MGVLIGTYIYKFFVLCSHESCFFLGVHICFVCIYDTRHSLSFVLVPGLFEQVQAEERAAAAESSREGQEAGSTSSMGKGG